MTWGAAWAVHKKNVRKFNKDRPKKPFPARKPGEHKKVGAIHGDPKKRLTEQPPRGMSQEDWQKRKPCPGCGSRWHFDCTKPSPKKPFRKGVTVKTVLAAFSVLAATAQSCMFPVHKAECNMFSSDCNSFVGLEPFEDRESRYQVLLNLSSN